MSTRTNTNTKNTLLSALPLPSRAPTTEEVDALLTMWGTSLKDAPADKHRLELDTAELVTVLGPRFANSDMMIAFTANKTVDMLAAAMSTEPTDCILEVIGTLVIGLAAGIRLGLMMERNDKVVAESLAMTASSSAQEDGGGR